MPKWYVGAREANRRFSDLIKAVEDEGVTVIITRRGKSIVQMQPALPERDADEVAARVDALFGKYARPMYFNGDIDRASLHDRNLKLDS